MTMRCKQDSVLCDPGGPGRAELEGTTGTSGTTGLAPCVMREEIEAQAIVTGPGSHSSLEAEPVNYFAANGKPDTPEMPLA